MTPEQFVYWLMNKGGMLKDHPTTEEWSEIVFNLYLAYEFKEWPNGHFDENRQKSNKFN